MKNAMSAINLGLSISFFVGVIVNLAMAQFGYAWLLFILTIYGILNTIAIIEK